MDDDKDHKLTAEEFRTGCKDFKLDMEDDEIATLFNAVDKDRSGTINFNEFLLALRLSHLPPEKFDR